MANTVRRHYKFWGSVQGVGFRYRAVHAANGMFVTGWVMNMPDGTVEMEVQGNPEFINKMLVMINRSNYIDITNQKMTEIPLVEDERGFHTKYDF